jgi:sugar transferase (PEP-CTERM/EpsH1 system associated)
MRILIIADYLPYPLIGGGRIRIYNLLRRVARHHEVSLAAFLEKSEDAEGILHLKEFCVRVETVDIQRSSRLSRLPGLVQYALSGKPPELKLLHSEELTEKIRQLASTMDFDIVQIEQSRMGLYLESIPSNNRCKSILMFQNFTSQQFGRVSHIEKRWDGKLRYWIHGVTMGYWEPRYAAKFDRCTTVSAADKQLLIKANPRLQVDVIPNGVDIEKYQLLPLPQESLSPSLIFVGDMGYSPCVDGALYFCREIFPRIRRTIATIELWIVGRNPRPEVLELNGNGVHVTGQVEDVIPYYRQSAVCVVPLRAGGGTRLKILEAMALGRPVVSTTLGCEGLDVVDGVNLLIADNPDQFTEKIVRVLTDRKLYQDISANGRMLVVAKYDWNIITDRLLQIYTELVNK